jgi:hypothetical protein
MNAYHRRIGHVTAPAEVVDPEMRMSRLRQICRTWRSCLDMEIGNFTDHDPVRDRWTPSRHTVTTTESTSHPSPRTMTRCNAARSRFAPRPSAT